MFRSNWCSKKWIILQFILLLANSYLISQTYSVGVAGVYGDDIDNVGLNLRGYVNSNNHKMCLGPEFTWFLTTKISEAESEIEKSLFEFNFNGHRVFELTNNLGLYGLTGLNFSREKEIIIHKDATIEEKIFEKWGVNIGGGFHYIINPNWIIFSEYDHLVSDLSQNTYTIGLFLTFGKGFKMGGHGEQQH